jgi:hypothetical protein
MGELDFVSWKIVQLVLWVGPFGIAAFLAAIAAAAFAAGYFFDPVAFGLKRTNRTDKPMGAQKLDHIKYDILPDGSLGPGDPRGLEDPE